jgi:hypothetical protein
MKFKNLSDWIMIDHCATRIIKDGNINDIADRVAFIEKTPRVRIKNSLRKVDCNIHYISKDNIDNTLLENEIDDISFWIYGDKGSSDYGLDNSSRKWCDEMLKALGWEVVSE